MSDMESISQIHDPSRQFFACESQHSILKSSEATAGSTASHSVDHLTLEPSSPHRQSINGTVVQTARDPEEGKQESQSRRRARWRQKEELYRAYPLYTVVPGEPNVGSPAQITVKGTELGKWLNYLEPKLTYHQLGAHDGVGLQLATLMISLAGMFPVTLAQVSQSGTSLNHPVTSLFGDIVMAFWVYAIDPAREFRGVRQELDGMRRAVQVMRSSELTDILWLLAKDIPNTEATEDTSQAEKDDVLSAARRNTPEIHPRLGEEFQVLRTSSSEASGSLWTPKSVHPLHDAGRMSPVTAPVTEHRKEAASCTTSVTLNTITTEGPPQAVWNHFADRDWGFNQRQWKAKAAGGAGLYEVWPGWYPSSGGKSEIKIKGQTFQHWADCIDTKHKGQDPAQLITQLSAMLDCATDPGPYHLDQLGEQKTVKKGAMLQRRSSFKREVALAVWIAAVDNETGYWTMVVYLEWLKKRAYSHVGLRLPPVLGARPTAPILEDRQMTLGAPLTAAGDSTGSPWLSHRSAPTSEMK